MVRGPYWHVEQTGRAMTPYRVRCPYCDHVGRGWWVGGDTFGEVRCGACDRRFRSDGRAVASTPARKDKED